MYHLVDKKYCPLVIVYTVLSDVLFLSEIGADFQTINPDEPVTRIFII